MYDDDKKIEEILNVIEILPGEACKYKQGDHINVKGNDAVITDVTNGKDGCTYTVKYDEGGKEEKDVIEKEIVPGKKCQYKEDDFVHVGERNGQIKKVTPGLNGCTYEVMFEGETVPEVPNIIDIVPGKKCQYKEDDFVHVGERDGQIKKVTPGPNGCKYEVLFEDNKKIEEVPNIIDIKLGKKCKYKIGDHINVNNQNATIANATPGQNGCTYTVKYDEGGKVENDVIETQIIAGKKCLYSVGNNINVKGKDAVITDVTNGKDGCKYTIQYDEDKKEEKDVIETDIVPGKKCDYNVGDSVNVKGRDAKIEKVTSTLNGCKYTVKYDDGNEPKEEEIDISVIMPGKACKYKAGNRINIKGRNGEIKQATPTKDGCIYKIQYDGTTSIEPNEFKEDEVTPGEACKYAVGNTVNVKGRNGKIKEVKLDVNNKCEYTIEYDDGNEPKEQVIDISEIIAGNACKYKEGQDVHIGDKNGKIQKVIPGNDKEGCKYEVLLEGDKDPNIHEENIINIGGKCVHEKDKIVHVGERNGKIKSAEPSPNGCIYTVIFDDDADPKEQVVNVTEIIVGKTCKFKKDDKVHVGERNGEIQEVIPGENGCTYKVKFENVDTPEDIKEDEIVPGPKPQPKVNITVKPENPDTIIIKIVNKPDIELNVDDCISVTNAASGKPSDKPEIFKIKEILKDQTTGLPFHLNTVGYDYDKEEYNAAERVFSTEDDFLNLTKIDECPEDSNGKQEKSAAAAAVAAAAAAEGLGSVESGSVELEPATPVATPTPSEQTQPTQPTQQTQPNQPSQPAKVDTALVVGKALETTLKDKDKQLISLVSAIGFSGSRTGSGSGTGTANEKETFIGDFIGTYNKTTPSFKKILEGFGLDKAIKEYEAKQIPYIIVKRDDRTPNEEYCVIARAQSIELKEKFKGGTRRKQPRSKSKSKSRTRSKKNKK
jgi:hypothetical protein